MQLQALLCFLASSFSLPSVITCEFSSVDFYLKAWTCGWMELWLEHRSHWSPFRHQLSAWCSSLVTRGEIASIHSIMSANSHTHNLALQKAGPTRHLLSDNEKAVQSRNRVPSPSPTEQSVPVCPRAPKDICDADARVSMPVSQMVFHAGKTRCSKDIVFGMQGFNMRCWHLKKLS